MTSPCDIDLLVNSNLILLDQCYKRKIFWCNAEGK